MTSIEEELDKILSSMPSPDLKLNEHSGSRTPATSSYDPAERERTGPRSAIRRQTFHDADEEDERKQDYLRRRTVADGTPTEPRTPTTAVPPLPNPTAADALRHAEKENERLKRELEKMQHKRLERSSSRTAAPSRGLERSNSERSTGSSTSSRYLERDSDWERVAQHSRESSVASDRHPRPPTPSRGADGLEKERERLTRDSDAQRPSPDRHARPTTPSSLALHVEPIEIPALRIKKDSDAHRNASAVALERGVSRSASVSSRGLERKDSESKRRDGSPKVQVLIVTPSKGADDEFNQESYRPITVLESGERERAGLKREIDLLKRENYATQRALDAAQDEDEKLRKELESLRKEADRLKKENEKYAREAERRDRRMSLEGHTADALAVAEHENDQLREELGNLKVAHARCEMDLQESIMAAEHAQREANAAISKAPTYINPDMIMTAGLHQVKALNEGIRRLSHNIAAGLEWDRDAFAGYNARGNYNWRDKALAELTPIMGEQSIRYIKSQIGTALPLAAMQAFVQILIVTFCDWKVSTWLSTDTTLADLFSQHKAGLGNRSVEPNDVPVYNAIRWRTNLQEQFGNLIADDIAVTGHQIHKRQEFDGILNRLRTTGPWRFKVDRTIISSLFAGLLQNLDDLRQTLEAGTASLLSYPGGYGIPSSETQDSYRQLVLWLVIPGTLVRENLVEVQGNVNHNFEEPILGNGGFGFGTLSITSPNKRASVQSATSSTSRASKKCRLEFMHNYNCLPPVVVERSLPFLGAE